MEIIYKGIFKPLLPEEKIMCMHTATSPSPVLN